VINTENQSGKTIRDYVKAKRYYKQKFEITWIR